MATASASTSHKLSCSSFFVSILQACEERAPVWSQLEHQIHQLNKDCATLSDQCTRGELTKEHLYTQLTEEIAPRFFSLQEQVEELRGFRTEFSRFVKWHFPETEWFFTNVRSSGVAPLNLRAAVEVDDTLKVAREVDQLVTHILQFTNRRIDPAWLQSANTLEGGLTLSGMTVGWVGTLRAYLPTSLGGTWPRIDALFEAQKRHHLLCKPIAFVECEGYSNLLSEQEITKRVSLFFLNAFPIPMDEEKKS